MRTTTRAAATAILIPLLAAAQPRCASLPSAVSMELAEAESWWRIERLRRFVGARAVLLGYDAGPDAANPEYAFLAADVSAACQRPAQRMTALLRLPGGLAAVIFDLGAEEPEASPAAGLAVDRVPLPRAMGGALTLRVLQPAHQAAPWRAVESVEMAGVRLAGWVVLFHAAPTSARTAVSFAAGGPTPLKILTGGLAPGMWDIWRNGWLEDNLAAVAPRAGALYFEGRPGSYFLRHRP